MLPSKDSCTQARAKKTWTFGTSTKFISSNTPAAKCCKNERRLFKYVTCDTMILDLGPCRGALGEEGDLDGDFQKVEYVACLLLLVWYQSWVEFYQCPCQLCNVF